MTMQPCSTVPACARLSLLLGAWLLMQAACSLDAMPAGGGGNSSQPAAKPQTSSAALHACKVEAGQACSLPACGCPADQTCAPDPNSVAFSLRCQPHSRLRAERCGSDRQCAPGLYCSEAGFCIDLCKADSDCSQKATGVCSALRWRDRAIPARGCAVACDPVTPQEPSGAALACPPGYGCDPVRAGVLDCTKHGDVADAEPSCTSATQCAPGSTCNAGSCVPYCAEDDDCKSVGPKSRCGSPPDRDPLLPYLKVCTPVDATSGGGAKDAGTPDGSKSAGSSSPDAGSPPPAPPVGDCKPGAQGCDDIIPKHCTDAGTWKLEEIQVGRCGAVCNAGDVSCQGTTQRTCGTAGTWEDATVQAGNCGAECTPGNEECTGNTLKRCSDTGVWQMQSVEGGVCDAICTPGQDACRGAGHWICSDAGKWSGGQVQGGSCGAVCTPRESSCNGTTSFVCGWIGQWLPGAIVAGLCGAICSPGDFTCNGTIRLSCNGGVAWTDPVVSTDCGATCNPGSTICDGTALRTCDNNGNWDAGVYSSDCDTRECIPGQRACGLSDNLLYCAPDAAGCYTYSPNAGDVHVQLCNDAGYWEDFTCDGVCNGGAAGLLHYCMVGASVDESGCYGEGICPVSP